MKTIWRRYAVFFCLTVIVMLTGKYSTYAGEQQKRVLFISSYSLAWETVPQQIEGIQEKLPDDAVIDYQFMDTKNVNTDESKQLFYERIRYFLQHQTPYDVLIVGDDAAFDFALEYRDELFSGIPVIFEGVEDVGKAEANAKDPLVTGVIEQLPYEKTIALARKLYPDAKTITAILDDTMTGKAERTTYYGYRSRFPDLDFEEINASAYTKEELLEKVAALPADTLLLYVICSESADGSYYSDRSVITQICDSAKIPVFSVVPHSMGKGFLGGMIPSHKEMGEIAGQMASDILSGTSASSIALQEGSPAEVCFDEKEMKRFHLKRSSLPKNTVIINHTKAWWEYTAVWFVAAGVAASVMLIVISRLIVAIRAKNRLNSTILKANEKLKADTRFDVLTGIYNRRALMDDVGQMVENGRPFAVIMYDLDNFKAINDCFGHEHGDAVLKEIARRVGTFTDAHTTSYRLGGDEFMLIVEGKRPEARTCVSHLMEQFGKKFTIGAMEKELHCSIGVALFPQDADTPETLFKAADRAMYSVKKSGKNDFAFYR